MYSTWKIVLPVVALAIVVVSVAKYKNNYTAPAAEVAKTEQNPIAEGKRVYDLNSPPITDADMYAVAQIASREPYVDAEEDRDATMVTLDNEALNNFNNASYVSASF